MQSKVKYPKSDARIQSGYLCKGKSVFKASDAENQDKDTDAKKTDKDSGQNLNVGHTIYVRFSSKRFADFFACSSVKESTIFT